MVMIELVITIAFICLMAVHIHSQHNCNSSGQALQMRYIGKRGLEQNARHGVPIIVEKVSDKSDLLSFSLENLTKIKGIVKYTHTSLGDELSVEEFIQISDCLSAEFSLVEGNKSFIVEAAGEQFSQGLCSKLSPYLNARQHLRYLSGPLGCKTVPCKSICDRNYVLVASGTVAITIWNAETTNSMIQMKHHGFLSSRSLDNMPQGTQFLIEVGNALFIPKNWWWSIEFGSSSSVIEANYQTVMNLLAHPICTINDMIDTYTSPQKYTAIEHCLATDEKTLLADPTTTDRVDREDVASPHNGEGLLRVGWVDESVPAANTRDSSASTPTPTTGSVSNRGTQSTHDCKM